MAGLRAGHPRLLLH